MKKLLFSIPLMLALAACDGTKEYDAYVEALNRQIEAVDTLSTPQEYAARLDSITAISTAFDQTGAKLNEDQKATIQALGLKLQESFNAAYERLASTPMILPDSIPVGDDNLPETPAN